jgi:predicted DNA-binding transcriptional regulator YafY
LPNNAKIDPAWIDNRIFFFPVPLTKIDLNIWETIADALRQNRQLELTYKSPSNKKTSTRVVDPYHLVNYKGEWYLSSLCHDKMKIRTFSVSRIQKIELLKDHFDMPKKYTRDKMFGDMLGIIWSSEKHDVKIRFSAEIAPYIGERTWHPKQKITKSKDGSIVLSFTTNHLNEVKDWLLSWGPNATALAPPKLVSKIKSDLKDMVKAYR